MPTKITTFIVTYNRPDLLKRTLDSLKGVYMGDHLVVIVNEINSQTQDVLDRYDFIDDVIASKKNRGSCWAINVGVEVAKFNNSDFVNYMQDDVVVKDGNFLNILLDIWENSKLNLGAISGYDYKITTETNRSYKEVTEIIEWKGHKLKVRGVLQGQNIFMPLKNWKEYFPISYIDIDGKPRGYPTKGRGADLDWWICLHSPNSINKKG
ncbi:unnamed protein product, partial [marine sediment metagenome]